MGQKECCTDEENIYSVMTYCPGGELFDYIDEHGPLSAAEARRMFKQLCEALRQLQLLGEGLTLWEIICGIIASVYLSFLFSAFYSFLFYPNSQSFL
jgi:serine/threonine protein kinase